MSARARFRALAQRLCVALALVAFALPAAGEDEFLSQPAAPVAPAAGQELTSRWGSSFNIGTGSLSGDFDPVFSKPVSGELNLFRQTGRWRFGAGVSFASLEMKRPFQEEDESGFQRTYLFTTRTFGTGKVRPYLQARVGLARIHPRSELFMLDPLPPDLATGDSTTRYANGFAVGLIPGIEWRLSRHLALDLSANISYFGVSDFDLRRARTSTASSGTTIEGRLGFRWFNDDGNPGGPSGVGADPNRRRDAWGVSRNYGWAAVEALGINMVASGVNEYVRNANFNQISPRSWWANLKEGFTFDDNEFRTNQYVHPFNGATYYNAARANGLGFWTSAAYGNFGAFFWECCGETHPMSFNDIISTGIGGMALGEMQYRLSSEIFNNQATGKGRFFKELAGFFVDPIRGFNRVISGRSRTVHDNPSDPMDWRPAGGYNLVMMGARVIGEGESISENTKTYFNVGFDHAYGNPFDNTRRQPFDFMDVSLQLSAQEKVPLNTVRILGDLWQKPLGDAAVPKHVFAISQRFDYMNNNAFEFGGQSVGSTLHSRFKLSEKLGLTTRVEGMWMILGAVNSEYSQFADVANQERLREYDYGTGLGAAAAATLSHRGRPILALSYRYQWLSVRNGSLWSRGQFAEEGSDGNHYLQGPGIRFVIPIWNGVGIGGDGFVFLRKSRFSFPLFRPIDQRNPQVRVFLSFSNGG